jgi:hypothetical protein
VPRHQTLRATIDWSYQLLSEQERSLVRRLAVFAGGWSLEAAEAVGADAVRREESVFEVLGQLVAKSMVLVEKPRETTPNIVRYRLLETIRQYAEEKLVEVGEADRARTSHRDWCLSLAEQGVEGMEGADQKLWWDRLNVEHDNLRMALSWSAAVPEESTPLLRLAGLLGRCSMRASRKPARSGIAACSRSHCVISAGYGMLSCLVLAIGTASAACASEPGRRAISDQTRSSSRSRVWLRRRHAGPLVRPEQCGCPRPAAGDRG